METEKKSIISHSVNYGLILAGGLIVYSLILYVFKVNIFSPFFGILQFLITYGSVIVFMSLGMKRYRDLHNDKVISFKEAFASGFIIGTLALIISGLFSFVFYTYFDPEFMQSMFEKLIVYMEEKNVPQEIIDQTVLKFESNMKPAKQLMGVFITGPIGGAVLSLIVAAIIKKDTNQQQF